jgi:hypothetical protein
MLGPDRHFRIETSTGADPGLPYSVNEDFDCATPDNILRLENLAKHLIAVKRQKLDQIVELLRPDKCQLDLRR